MMLYPGNPQGMLAKKSISRRNVLRGIGAAVCLPFLESLAPRALAATTSVAGAAAAKRPVRMAVVYMANGVNVSKWVPQGFGRDFELSPTLSPLAPLKNDLLVLTELTNRAAFGGDGHYVKSAGLLTGTTITKTTGKDIRAGGVSMDQLAAQRIGHLTPLPSLELGIEPVETGIDGNVGYTRLYSSHISWATPATPVGKEINPRLAFDRLFRSNARAEGDNRSVLDLVGEQARAVRSRVGGADRDKLDNYLESIRVPLIVWTFGEPAAAEAAAWGQAEKVTSLGKMKKAFSRLEKELAAQHILWVDGLHLPQSIELSPEAAAVLEIVR